MLQLPEAPGLTGGPDPLSLAKSKPVSQVRPSFVQRCSGLDHVGQHITRFRFGAESFIAARAGARRHTVRAAGRDVRQDLKDSITAADRQYMQHALRLARQGLGKTAPNPAVGCVIVRNGEVVGEGFHPKAGEPHAEVFALRDAGERAQGATAYVTLEPCNHYGRTPPCSQALVAARVSRVVVGVGDPNPLVGGSGIATLRQAGICVDMVGGAVERECFEINRHFMAKMQAKAGGLPRRADNGA